MEATIQIPLWVGGFFNIGDMSEFLCVSLTIQFIHYKNRADLGDYFMEVKITIPTGTDISMIEQEYPDIYIDEEDFEGYDTYFVGKEGDEWLTHEEAVECCGFIEGAIHGSETCIEGNGEWAQNMLSREDFSSLAISDEYKADLKRISDIWWTAHGRGKKAAADLKKQRKIDEADRVPAVDLEG